MRTLFFVLALLPACKKPEQKPPPAAAPAVGSQELMRKLSAELRELNEREYGRCQLSSAVVFDGKGAYGGRMYGSAGPEEVALIFGREGDAWKCVDEGSIGPGEGPPCEASRDACR